MEQIFLILLAIVSIFLMQNSSTDKKEDDVNANVNAYADINDNNTDNNTDTDKYKYNNTQLLIIIVITIAGVYYYMKNKNKEVEEVKPKIETKIVNVCPSDEIDYEKIETTDYPRQGDLFFYKATNLENCKKECDKLDNCHGFVYRDDKVCWLKDGSPTIPVYNHRTNYYYKDDKEKLPELPKTATAVYSTNYISINNVDYPNPMGEILFARGNIKGCEIRCTEFPFCHGYVRRESDQSCWLKDYSVLATEGVKSPGFTYHYKAGKTKPPLPKT